MYCHNITENNLFQSYTVSTYDMSQKSFVDSVYEWDRDECEQNWPNALPKLIVSFTITIFFSLNIFNFSFKNTVYIYVVYFCCYKAFSGFTFVCLLYTVA